MSCTEALRQVSARLSRHYEVDWFLFVHHSAQFSNWDDGCLTVTRLSNISINISFRYQSVVFTLPRTLRWAENSNM